MPNPDIESEALSQAVIKKKYEELKVQRSTTKANMTRIKNYVTANINTITAVELECRVNIFDQYWKLWLSHQLAMEKLNPDEATHQLIRGEVEDLYCDMKVMFNTKKPLGDDDTLSTTEKYNHLRHCLTGPALQTIDSLGKSAENYAIAMSTLKKRYDNKCLIFQEHISEIVDLPKISKNSASQLRSLVDNINSHLNAMKTIGSEVDIMNSLIIHIVSSKLDFESQSKYEDSFDYSSLPKWEDMHTILTKRCQLLEIREGKAHTSTVAANSTRSHYNHQQSQHKKKSEYVQSSYASTSSSHIHNSASSSSTSICSFCSDPHHRIEKCTNFTKLPVTERFLKAKQLLLCINCLRPSHTIKFCKASMCKVCSKKHHTLLHRYDAINNSNDSNQQSSQLVPQMGAISQSSNYSACIQPKFSSNISSLEKNNLQTTASNVLSTLKSKTLHSHDNNSYTTLNAPEASASPTSETTSFIGEDHIFLATAVILVKDNTGCYQFARALLDSGSQLNFITDRLVHLLQLKRHTLSGQVIGIGQNSSRVKQETTIIVKSRLNNFITPMKCWILPTITNNHPERNINKNNIQIPLNLELADPAFFKSQKIDVLIGAEKFFELLSVGQIKLFETGPVLQKTIFGWIISGHYQSKQLTNQICATATGVEEKIETTEPDFKLNELVEKFWQNEEVDINYCKLNQGQKNCETLFIESIRKLEDNRLMVKLPFRKAVDQLGDSFIKAKARFFWLEKKLEKDPEIKYQYSEFLQEYVTLGHMDEVKLEDVPKSHYFIPHQYVLRPQSSTTKLRVVFNASCPTTTNISLNDILSVGPTVQNDIFAILFKFRCFRYALTADVSKMYSQIYAYPEDRNFQLIIWRDTPYSKLKIFRLNTLTYGTASAPYLATRCINYLADQHSIIFPKSAEIIKSSVYVDDLIAGGDDLAEIRQIQTEVSTILQSAELVLRKCYYNEPSLLQQIAPEDLEKPLRLNDLDIIRTLGMIWDPKSDEFRFNVDNNEIKSSKTTKRSVLSDLAKLFDPLGLVNPVVVTSKLFMQELWLLKLSWDESLPQFLHERWLNFKKSLAALNSIKIPRFVLSGTTVETIQIHGFCDSSVRAYGACIYVRTININGEINANLIAAKSRIAPSKKTRTLPELELLGAELLSKLWSKIQPHFPKQIDDIYFWTDSTIVLGWISSHASKWQTFVANRVSRIQELTSNITWNHVNSKANPADIISRGCTVTELQDSIWLKGPDFLYKTQQFWPPQKVLSKTEELPGQRKLIHRKTPISLVTIRTMPTILDTIYNTSNFVKLRRIFSYIYRFIHKLRDTQTNKTKVSSRNGMSLNVDELNEGFMKIIYIVQREEFKDDINHLIKHQIVHHTSNLKHLTPFIDERDGLHRVGGRLRHSKLPYTARCPILLPKNNKFVNSFTTFLHFRHCHAGPQALMAIMNQQFWIINARDYTRKIVRNCVHCFRYKPKLLHQIMGDLPADRVNVALAFSISGVDFCGPIYTSPTTRGHKMYKTYIAVFVCFISKGVHLEIVTELSTNAFIATLKRFISRRMLCKKLYCDNATNFVGARRTLKELRQKFLNQSTQSEITAWCAENSINFEHIPPRSPHFGGLWEAAVKSAKSLLYPTLQNCHVTYEGLATICCQIEAVLNSRPITQLSTDPNDERALTPAHFWNQAPNDTFVEPDMSNLNISYITKWQKISAIQQHFWKRWSTEYITTLQKRSKWFTQSSDELNGKLVLIHEDNLPPQKWLLGRIVKGIPGQDNRIRVVDVKTKCGIFRRSIHKLALLSTEEN